MLDSPGPEVRRQTLAQNGAIGKLRDMIRPHESPDAMPIDLAERRPTSGPDQGAVA